MKELTDEEKDELRERLLTASLRLNLAQNECVDLDFTPIVDILHDFHELLS